MSDFILIFAIVIVALNWGPITTKLQKIDTQINEIHATCGVKK